MYQIIDVNHMNMDVVTDSRNQFLNHISASHTFVLAIKHIPTASHGDSVRV